MAGRDVGGNAATINDEGRDEVEQALDGIGAQIEGAAAQQEILKAAPKTHAPMNGVNAIKVSLEGEPVCHIDKHGEQGTVMLPIVSERTAMGMASAMAVSVP